MYLEMVLLILAEVFLNVLKKNPVLRGKIWVELQLGVKMSYTMRIWIVIHFDQYLFLLPTKSLF